MWYRNRIKGLINLRKTAQDCILKAQTLMARTPKVFTPYQPGDQVWLEGTNIKTTHPTAKLAPKRHGPFTIKEAISAVTYRLNLSWFHVGRFEFIYHLTVRVSFPTPRIMCPCYT